MIRSERRPLVARHFLRQASRPDGVREVEVDSLDPFLRGLLFTDGTVTRALGVHTLRPVAVEVLGQATVAAPAEVAAALDVETGAEAIRRQVRIGLEEEPAPLLWAESHLVPARLPERFFRDLDGSVDGIGQSLQQGRLESCRELLWFGLQEAPGWAGPGRGAETLRRLYRVVTAGAPAILISEGFAVAREGGLYRLAGLTVGAGSLG